MKMKISLMLSAFLFCFALNAQSTILVENLNDTGLGSFKHAVDSAQTGDTIRFNPNLIANGSDTLFASVKLNNNVVIKGLYNSTDTLYFSRQPNKPIFRQQAGGNLDHVVLDSIIFTFPNNDGTFFGSILSLGQGGDFIEMSNCQILYKEVFNEIPIMLYDGSSLKVTNCYFLNTGGTFSYLNEGDYKELTFDHVTIKNDPVSGNLYTNRLDIRKSSSLTSVKDKVNITHCNFINTGITALGDISIHVSSSTITDNYIQIGSNTMGSGSNGTHIDLNMTNSTFSTVNSLVSRPIQTGALQSSPSMLKVNLKNCTFNNVTSDSVNYTGSDYFGSALDSLSITGCIFNKLGKDNLPINNNGGYNIFGFTQNNKAVTDLDQVSSEDIDLGPLQNNGGFAPTHRPSLTSVAVNNGNPNDLSDAQNGSINGIRDIGAAEAEEDDTTPVIPVAEYCSLESNRNKFEWIKKVDFNGDLVNLSGKDGNGYGDYTTDTLVVDTNEMVTVKLIPGYKRRAYREYWRVWIDWNYDGDFDDAGEKVFQKKGKRKRTGSFTVPVNVSDQNLRMRVAMRWRRYAPSCGTYKKRRSRRLYDSCKWSSRCFNNSYQTSK